MTEDRPTEDRPTRERRVEERRAGERPPGERAADDRLAAGREAEWRPDRDPGPVEHEKPQGPGSDRVIGPVAPLGPEARTPAGRIATAFGIGTLPAPGTWASLAAIPLAWALHALGGFWLLGPATVLIFGAGWWATELYMRARHVDDPPEVVIDEVAGMLVALWPLSYGLTMIGAGPEVWPWPGFVLGFLVFRFFDIVKPPPVSWADRMPGTKGIMLDDIVAGVITAALSLLAAGVAHGWF